MTLAMILGEEPSLKTPMLMIPPVAVMVMLAMMGADEDWFFTPMLSEPLGPEAEAVTPFMFGEEPLLAMAKLLADEPEAVAVTLVILVEDEALNTPTFVEAAPKAVAVTESMLAEDELFCTPKLKLVAPVARAVTCSRLAEVKLLLMAME
jgi:hypothetical protein